MRKLFSVAVEKKNKDCWINDSSWDASQDSPKQICKKINGHIEELSTSEAHSENWN